MTLYHLARLLHCLLAHQPFPGPGALSCMASGLKVGWRKGLWNIFGLQAGITVMPALVALGTGALIAASVWTFTAIKWFRVVYLVWLGIQKWRDASTAQLVQAADGDDETGKAAAGRCSVSSRRMG